jgi:hypothetical protein
MLYDQLIRQARQTYAEFLEKNRELGQVREVVAKIEDALGAAASSSSSVGSEADTANPPATREHGGEQGGEQSAAGSGEQEEAAS